MKRLFISSILIAMLCACGHSNASRTIADINTAVSAGEMDLARQMCSKLVDNDTTLSATQLVELALAYMSIAESNDDIEDMASAAKCYNMAFIANSDSAKAFIAGLPQPQQTQLRLLADVSFGVDDFDLEQDPDEGEADNYKNI